MKENSDVEIAAPLKYIPVIFTRSFELRLINWEVIIKVAWFKNYITSADVATNQSKIFAIKDARLNVPVITLST